MTAESDTPQPGSDGFVLETLIPFRLLVLSNRLSNAFSRAYQPRFGLTIPEWRLMAVLGRFGPMSAHDAVDLTAMDKVRISRAVRGLLLAGQIERVTDPEDRRRSVLTLTKKGTAVYAEVAPMALERERQLLAQLTPLERADLVRVLTLLERSAEVYFAKQQPEAARRHGG